MKPLIILCISSAAVAFTTAHAQTITPDSNSGLGYTVSSTDLIEGQVGTWVYTPKNDDGDNITSPVLTDGTFGGEGPNTDDITAGGGDSVKFALTTPETITEIDSYAGGDSARGSQAFTVSFALNNSTNYTTDPISVFFTNNQPNPQDSQVAVTGIDLADVTGIEFTFQDNNNDHGYQRYREIDVFGTAVPEPSAYALVGMGLAASAFVARHRGATQV